MKVVCLLIKKSIENKLKYSLYKKFFPPACERPREITCKCRNTYTDQTKALIYNYWTYLFVSGLAATAPFVRNKFGAVICIPFFYLFHQDHSGRIQFIKENAFLNFTK